MENALTAVRCKMVCNQVVDANGTVNKVSLGAIYSNVPGENSDFSKATPWGNCEMGIYGEVPAAQFFKPGKRYYMTFTEAPD